MAKIIFITGGARSGKSSFAEKLASTHGGEVIFLATAETRDKEMADRIKKHKSKRNCAWKTVEEPININVLNKFRNFEGAVILDCVTLWLSNMIHKFGIKGVEGRIFGDIRTLLKTVKTSKFTLIVVSNELGMGIVPENRLAREFRDIAGRCNQLIARMADEVYLMISGIELKITHTQPPQSPLTGGGEMSLANYEALSKRGVFKYNPKLTDRARELRKNPTPMEKKLWENLLKERPQGYKFLRQKPIGNYILDFYCSELLLAIEIDGEIHNKREEYDKERNDFLNAYGIKVIRIANSEVENNFDSIKKNILKVISTNALNYRKNNPPPRPLSLDRERGAKFPPVKGD